MLRQPRSGRPAPLARLVVLLLLVALVGISAPVLIPVISWVLSLL